MAQVVGFYTEGRGRRRKVHPLTSRAPRVTTVTVHVAPTRARRHKRVWVVSEHVVGEHEAHRGDTVYEVKEHVVKGHRAHAVEEEWPVKAKKQRRLVIRFGGHFKEVAEKIAKEYMKKGYSKEEAERIGRATAAAVYRHKLALAYRK